MWTVVFGAVYASKHNEHVSFSLIYDRFGPKGRAAIGIIGNLIIITAFCLMYFPTIEYVLFIGIKTTPVLKVPFDLMYAPFALFITFSGGYLIRDIGRAIIVFRTPGEILNGMEEYRKEIMYLPNEEKETLMKQKEAELKAAYDEKKGGERV
jgi:TRAP-type C4-dicarboxylate transport system permease small subunit